MGKKHHPYHYLGVSFGTCDKEIADWLKQQPNQAEYVKALILSEKRFREQGTNILVEFPLPQYDSNWKRNFELLQEFKKEVGRFPYHFEEYKGVKIGRWLSTCLKRDKNKPERMKLLQRIGAWDIWDYYYSLVLEHINEFGRLPYYHEEYKGVKIGQWLSTRISFDKNNPERMELLQRIGAFDRWDYHYNLVLDYIKEFDKLPTRKTTYHGCAIGTWLQRQRDAFYKEAPTDILSKEQREKIEKLSLFKTDWDAKFALCQKFYKEFGRPPAYAEIYHGVKIGRWVSYTKNCLDPVKEPEKIEKLCQIGVKFDENRTHYSKAWDENFELVKAFQEEFGRLPHQSETYQGVNIGAWLINHAQKDRGDSERFEKLGSIGVYDKWQQNYTLVLHYMKTYGKLPSADEVYQGFGIGNWLRRQQKALQQDNVLSLEQEKKILELGELPLTKWDIKYELLKTFKEEIGRLPTEQEDFGGEHIGKWLGYMRRSTDPIKHPERARKLEALGVSLRMRK